MPEGSRPGEELEFSYATTDGEVRYFKAIIPDAVLGEPRALVPAPPEMAEPVRVSVI